MTDNTRMNPGDGGDLIATDALDTLNGQPADAGLKVQRVKVGFGPDGGLQDVDAAHPMPVAGPLTNAELRAAAVPVSGPLTDAQLRAAAVPVSMAAAPLPSGAATAALQSTGNTALANLDADVGAPTDAAAGADGTGNYSLISAAKRSLLNWATLLARVPALVGGRVPVDGSGVTQPVSGPLTNAQLRAADVPVSGPLTDAQLRAAAVPVSGPLTDTQLRAGALQVQVGNFPAQQVVNPGNIVGKFRESFETFVNGGNWSLSAGDGDIVQIDGNAVSASYLVISKDPLKAGTETQLTFSGSFPMPIELAVGLSMSQRVLGQELSMEIVSTEPPLPAVPDIAIASISQSGTTLTVNTVAAHGLTPGKRIGIAEVAGDSRLNYPALVVATTPSATSFTCTAGPGFNVPTLTTGPFTNQGVVYFRSALGFAQNGVSQIFDTSSATSASIYSRSSAGDVLPSGAAGGSHAVTMGSTNGTQAAVSPYTYSFLPGTEYKIILQADRVQWMDSGIDSASAPSSRLIRTQVVPDSTKLYTLRFRMTNNRALTVPSARIVSAVKSGSATVTITTDGPHGITTGDWVGVIGIRDQTNFTSSTANTQVLSVPTANTLTVSLGSSATATSYGGCVFRQNGYNVPAGFPTIAVQSAGVTANELSLTASGNWAWLVGDYVNVYGLREQGTGADLGLDGVYRVVDVSTTSIRLAPMDASTVLPAVNASCGGTVIKRTDARLSFVRIFEYLRERVEMMANGAQSASVPVSVNGTAAISGSVTPTAPNTYSLLTSSNLAAGATYTGASTNAASSSTSSISYISAVNVSVLHTAGLTPGTLIFEVGSETSSTAPTTWFAQFVVPIASSSNWQTFTFPLTSRFYRVRFVNGATAQTAFRLATVQMYNGALGNNLTFPDCLLIPLSATALSGAGVFTGAALDFGDTNRVYKTIKAAAFASHDSATDGFAIQVSRDGSTWRTAVSATVAANVYRTIECALIYRYARVVFTNGATAQTAFSLDCQAEV